MTRRHTPLPILLRFAGVCAIALSLAAQEESRPKNDSAPTAAPAAELLQPVGQAKPRPFDPTESYALYDIEGWTVRVNQRLLRDDPKTAEKTLELLRFQFYQITRELPSPALAKLRQVSLWVELDDPLFPCMCYHANLGWVAGHGLNPEKAKCVELANAKTFLKWVHSQPWMVFHEFAHAYHDQFLESGFDNEPILAAYRDAKEAKIYDAILRNNGHTEKAYAMTNQMEYFAELSESFFGTNDFYPFIRAELKVHDPKGYDVLKEAWGIGKK
ncbi:MAG TPA: hypothetical protein VFC46_03925, partial [Humisphaera sp.]|nr:hypothetical protein [Humisphaera sp.]